MKTLIIETYPDMTLADGEENPDYDDTIREIEVPMVWAVCWIRNEFDCSFKVFMENYTWDDTWLMYCAAYKANVLIAEDIVGKCDGIVDSYGKKEC